MTDIIDIVAIKNGNVVSLAYSDSGGPNDRKFIAEHPAPAYTIERMPVSEAVDRHLTYLRESGL